METIETGIKITDGEEVRRVKICKYCEMIILVGYDHSHCKEKREKFESMEYTKEEMESYTEKIFQEYIDKNKC